MKIIFARFLFYLPFTFVLFISSCSKDESEVKQPVLVEATYFLPRTAQELQLYVSASSGLNFDPSLLKYDVDIYKVKYRTTYKDEDIIASGLVILPKTTESVGMVSFQHGTIVAKQDAPTLSSIQDTALILYACLGSTGFIGVVPDFIGFGASDEIFHPYYIEEATALAIIDNLKAARELALTNEVNFNGKLFLAGYSQGGYATMAAHKYMEENEPEEFDLIASFPAAGGYDIKGVQEFFFSQETYDQPHYLAYVAASYQSYYGWTNTFTTFFQEPYASRIPALFDGNKGASEINQQLTPVVSDLVNEDVLNTIDSDPDYAFLVNAFVDNSLLDWTPKTKMYMYHGDADITVPYQNSVDTYNHFLSTGASSDVVTFTPLPGADHSTGIFPYIEQLVPIIIALQ